MSFWSRLLRGPDLRPALTRLAEQVDATSFSAAPTEEDRLWSPRAGSMEEDLYWRRLSDNWYQKDVIPSTYLEIHNRCFEMYNANPLAARIVELITDFVLGDTVVVEAASPRVQQAIDRFWFDRENHMDTRVHSLVTELSLYGEQFVRFFVSPVGGDVKIGQIDPSLIDQIETDPENVERALRFHQRPVGPGGSLWSATAPADGTQSPAPTMEPSNLSYPGDQVLAGTWYAADREVLQFKINAVSNAKRGKSDLATLLPWLRRYQDWLIDRVRINKYKGAFLWDIQLAGADAKTIDRKRMQYSYAPAPGSVVVHNESEQWTAVQPRIAAEDAAADGNAIKMMIAAGAGLPEHYLAEGGSVNRATAAEMGLPTYRKLIRRQRLVEQMLRAILDRVIDEGLRAGTIPKSADRAYRIELPQLTPGEDELRASAAATLITALTTASAQRWMSRQTAMRLLYEVVDPAVSLADELARVDSEEAGTPVPAPGSTAAASTGRPSASARANPHPSSAYRRRARLAPARPQAGGTRGPR